jgi:DNA-binding MarR family transcriptional regulator
MDKVAVSRAVAALRRAGRIERAVDARDRRRSRLTLSATGRSVYAAVVPFARRFERRLLAALTPADRDALDRILGRLVEELRHGNDTPP